MSNGISRRRGDDYERRVVDYFNTLGLPVRRAKRGNDTGDILGVPRLAIECKGEKKFLPANWIDQMKIEQQAANADYGIVIARRLHKANVGDHYFIMTVRDGLLLLQQAGVIELPDGD